MSPAPSHKTVKSQFWILSLLILLGGIDPSNAAPKPVDPKVLHIINRLSFGPRPGDVERVESIGVKRYIKEQLKPDSIPESPSLTNKLSQLQTLRLNPVQLLESGISRYEFGTSREKPNQEEINATQRKSHQIAVETVNARLLRATTSPRQLQEVMVDFWYNYFNVYIGKGRSRLWVGAYEQQAIRPYALGRFRDLLGATARHPAMLFYLDNWQNRYSNNPAARRRNQSLNENYARELMELHTLGVDGGYTQQDVITLARIFTGWGLVTNVKQKNDGSGFYFDPKHHDFSDKVFLGQKIKGSGQAEGEQALDILARSPATARHISYKLAQYFVSDRPPTTLVKRLAQRYLSTDGNIRDVLDTLFQSPEFWDTKNFNAKYKTPYQYAISSVRATGIEVNNTRPIADLLQQLAMPVYGCITPDGYKNTQDAWLNPDAMTRRLNFATAIANGNIPIAAIPKNTNADTKTQVSGNMTSSGRGANIKPVPVDAGELANTLGNLFSATTQNAIASSPQQIRAALILGSPEFMRR